MEPRSNRSNRVAAFVGATMARLGLAPLAAVALGWTSPDAFLAGQPLADRLVPDDVLLLLACASGPFLATMGAFTIVSGRSPSGPGLH